MQVDARAAPPLQRNQGRSLTALGLIMQLGNQWTPRRPGLARAAPFASIEVESEGWRAEGQCPRHYTGIQIGRGDDREVGERVPYIEQSKTKHGHCYRSSHAVEAVRTRRRKRFSLSRRLCREGGAAHLQGEARERA